MATLCHFENLDRVHSNEADDVALLEDAQHVLTLAQISLCPDIFVSLDLVPN